MVGTGAGCTEADLDAALSGGGVITFDCGSDATHHRDRREGHHRGQPWLMAAGRSRLVAAVQPRIFLVESDVDLTLQNITLADATGQWAAGADGPSPRQ